MSYTVTDKNLNKAIEMVSFINCHVREMERKHGASVCNYTTYNTQREKLTDETILLSTLLGVEISEIEKLISDCTHEMERAVKS